MNATPTFGPVVSALGLLTGVATTGIGVGVLVRTYEDPFGAVWSSLLVVVGVIVLISYVALLVARRPQPPAQSGRDVALGDEVARYLPRRPNPGTVASNFVFVLLGGWFLVMGAVGAVEENWFWPVLAAFPAAYFLGFPVLRAVGLFRPGGVWLTSTRVVNEQYGLRSEIALSDVKTAYSVLGSVQIEPNDPAAVHHTRRTPRLWCARLVPGEMLVLAEGLEGGVEGFAAEVRRLAEAAQGGGRKRRWQWG